MLDDEDSFIVLGSSPSAEQDITNENRTTSSIEIRQNDFTNLNLWQMTDSNNDDDVTEMQPYKMFPDLNECSTMPMDQLQMMQCMMDENGLTAEYPQNMNEDLADTTPQTEAKNDEQGRIIDELRATVETLKGENKALNEAMVQAERRCQEATKRAEDDKAALKRKLEESQSQIEAERISVKADFDDLIKDLSEKQAILSNMSGMIEQLTAAKQQKPPKLDADDTEEVSESLIQVNSSGPEGMENEHINEQNRLAEDVPLMEQSCDLETLQNQIHTLTADLEAKKSVHTKLSSSNDRILSDLKLLQQRNQHLINSVMKLGKAASAKAARTTNERLDTIGQSLTAISRQTNETDETLENSTGSNISAETATEHNKDSLELTELELNVPENVVISNSSSFRSNSSETEVENKLSNEADITFETKKIFYDSTGTQFVKTIKPALQNVKQLHFSARLLHEDMEIVLHNEGCLIIVDDDFVAEVEIKQPNLLEAAKDFQEAETMLYEQLRIKRVIIDNREKTLKLYRKALASGLKNVLKRLPVDTRSRVEYVQLSRIVGKLGKSDMLNNISVCEELVDGCEELKNQAAITAEEERRVKKRSSIFQKIGLPCENDSQYLYQILRKSVLDNSKRYKNMLLKNAPGDLKELLCNVSEDKLIFITKKDVQLFTDLENSLNKEIFSKPLQNFQLRWIQQINLVQTDYLNHNFKATNQIYLFLCKSLEEIIVQISDMTSIQSSELLKSSAFGWQPMKKILWSTENLSTKCLEQQYYLLFRLLHHFELKPNCHQKPLNYTFQLLKKPNRNLDGKTTQSIISSEQQLCPSEIPEELIVWYCLLDDALAQVFPQVCDLTIIESILQSYLKLIHETNLDQLETLRVATHNIIQFIVEIVQLVASSSSDSSVDQRILQQQFALTSSILSNTTNFRDLASVFISYWRLRSEVITKIVSKMPLPEMELLKQQLLNVVLVALQKCVEHDYLIAFFRAYEAFVIDLNEVPLDWFIKDLPNVPNMQAIISLCKIELVPNKLQNTDNKTYRVIDLKNFPAFCPLLGQGVVKPKHYPIEVLRTLICHISSQLQRESWPSSKRLSTADQLTTTCDLISTIQRSLLCMQEQPDYVSFEQFYDESVEPFTSLIENSTSRKDFSHRAQLLIESFGLIRKQNEMHLAAVLQVCEELNPNFDPKLFKEYYQKYTKHLESYMQMSAGKDCPTAATLVANKVKESVSNDMHFTTWNVHFKQHQIPQILAGLGSLWSILVSKDGSCAGTYVSPNCVQILCVLRLLSVDQPAEGIEKHLAQVLTGQGKSLILALVAALLALTGHKVSIGCFSNYLAERDQETFRDFYSTLGVTDVIIYGTLDSLKKSNQSNTFITSIFKNSVLLVDDMDMFLTEQFFGNTYTPAVLLTNSGLVKIQEFIWEIVSGGCSSVGGIIQKVEELLQSFAFSQMNDFNGFLASNKRYKILTDEDELKGCTNRSLFDEHLRQMIIIAIDVFKSPPSKWADYALNSLGQITLKNNVKSVTSTGRSYTKSFNYLRLQKDNFVTQIKGVNNYGYLYIRFGSLSYAMLPIDYPLILGVSGTLTDMNEHETHIIEQLYQIKQRSVMPTLCGNSSLQIDKSVTLLTFSNKQTWKKHIFSQASKIVTANRAALIFFDSDHELNGFKAEYGGQLDQLNVLTENTRNKKKYINEAGIAKTITCATREMSRGVNYRPSPQVEQNGGMHVIQTFFSMDVKEEAQIKSRTVQQNSNGSYELAVCRQDLIRYKLVSEEDDEADVSYHKLDEKRKKISLETFKSISSAIENNKTKHTVTMSYMKSFFRT